MTKISQYLNEHLSGDLSTDASILKYFSFDGSILSIKPEIATYPRDTNDIRKIARFCYQLAEKGHGMSITARGSGTDRTGAAIGSGVIVSTKSYMNKIFEFDSKQKLVRMQPGVTLGALSSALELQGFIIPAIPRNLPYATIGGALANNISGELSGKYGYIEDYVDKLEVVLANGDVLQTSRISKRELSKKKGLQTMEGDVYRGIDSLIEDNADTIKNKIPTETIDNSGYASIAKVKQKNGSFDLSPLFIGSQGTLGVVSEMILKAEYNSNSKSLLVAMFKDSDKMRDYMFEFRKLDPDILEFYDGELLKKASSNGKKYDIYKDIESKDSVTGVFICGYTDFNERTRKRKLKKVEKLIKKSGDIQYMFAHKDEAALQRAEEFQSVVFNASQLTYSKDHTVSNMFNGVYIPENHFEEFSKGISELENAYDIKLPMSGHVIESVYSYWPEVSMKTVSGKQKLLKLYDDFSKLVDKHDGSLVAESGEGRLKAPFSNKSTDADVLNLYDQIRKVFDPKGILNTGVKSQPELRDIVKNMRKTDDSSTRHSEYV